MHKLFTPRWILTTLLAAAGVFTLIRLGFWQLDRLEWRRVFNARVTAQLNAPQLDLNREIPLDELYDMEYRSVTVRGEYDHRQEVLLRNQVWEDRHGFHVLTPLRIESSDYAVLIDRGWIPFDQAGQDVRARFYEPGLVQVSGMIRRGQEKPDFGGVPDPTLQPGETRLDAWNVVNLTRIQEQTDLSLLAVYIQQAPDPAWNGLPYRSYPEIELSEGSHLSYAVQWFTFAAILAVGYPFFVRRQLSVGRSTGRDPDDSMVATKAG